MKKFFSFVVVLTAVAMVSCAGNANSNAATETVEATETVVETVAPACDSTACAEKCDSTKAACCETAK